MFRDSSVPTATTCGDFPYDSWERVYRESGENELPWDSAEPHPLLKQLFGNHQAHSGARALDLGCGTGASSRLLAGTGYQVDAWDISMTAIDRARRQSSDSSERIKFSVGNVLHSAFGNPQSYDLVLDFFFLHHVQMEDLSRYFTGIRRCLRPNGVYVVGVFIHDGTPFQRQSLYSDGQVIYWSRRELEAHLPGARLTDERRGRGGDSTTNFPMGLFTFTDVCNISKGCSDVHP